MTYVEIWKVATWKATHNKARHPAAQRRDAQHRDDRLISFFCEETRLLQIEMDFDFDPLDAQLSLKFPTADMERTH